MHTKTLVERQARAAAGVEPEPGLAEIGFLLGIMLGAAAGAGVLAWLRYWRLV